VIPNGEAVITFIDGLDLDENSPVRIFSVLDLHLPKRNCSEILRHPDKHFM